MLLFLTNIMTVRTSRANHQYSPISPCSSLLNGGTDAGYECKHRFVDNMTL